MIRYLLAAAILTLPAMAQAQQAGHSHSMTMDHGVHGMAADTPTTRRPTEPGQAAFAAIQEIVEILDANPDTDWSKVDIAALRRHLVDMNNVTLYADAVASSVKGGVRFRVTGTGRIRESIRRMVTAHARTMDGHDGWHFTAGNDPEGAILTVTVPNPADLDKVKGLGFFGIMAYGMHHQQHHLMIASGNAPHE